jgi:putative Holliday junction resolvase
MTRLMALDIGEVRIGVAVSDATGLLASPYTTLYVTPDEAQLWADIERLISETEAEELVVGLPISLDGQVHAQGERIQAFVNRLKEHITIPLTLWDERYSTVEAARLLAERDQDERGKRHRRSRRGSQRNNEGRRRQSMDALAATIILQDYLDHLRSQQRVEDRLL